MSETTIDKQFKMIIEITAKQDARLERLENSVETLISGQNKLISLVEKVLDVQDEQKDLIEALAIRSTYQDAEIRKIKNKNIV
jgi:methylphosphotriester-DNA--protein-cysteine methyltransferase